MESQNFLVTSTKFDRRKDSIRKIRETFQQSWNQSEVEIIPEIIIKKVSLLQGLKDALTKVSLTNPVTSISLNYSKQTQRSKQLHQHSIVRLQSWIRGKQSRKKLPLLKKNYKYRMNVINELVTTEYGYVNDLDVIIDVLLPKMEQKLDAKSINILFGNIRQIHQLNSGMSQSFQLLNKDSKYLLEISKILQIHVNYFKAYFSYYNEQSESQALFKKLMTSNEEFKEIILSFNKSPQSRGLGWEGFMVKPIQRLPKYELLLRDFVKHTEENNYLFPKYQKVYTTFVDVLQKNNIKLNESWQNQMFELQKHYGSNNLQILDPTRKVIKEENCLVLIDNVETKVLMYILSDLILVCVQDDKSESGYKLVKHVFFNEKSFCTSLQGTRFYSYLYKIVGLGQTIIIICSNHQEREKSMAQTEKIFYDYQQRQSTIKSSKKNIQDLLKIEVQIRGTEERDTSMKAYTVYVIEIIIYKVVQQVYLRFSELKQLNEFLAKEHPDIKIPHFTSTTQFNNKDVKVIERRRLEIEDLILLLLVNENFIEKEPSIKNKILKMINLDSDFYDYPELIKQAQQSEQPGLKKLVLQNRIQISQMRLSLTPMSANKTTTKQLQINVKFYDETIKTYTIEDNTKAIELIDQMAEGQGIKDPCNYKIFETNDSMDKLRPIMDDEIISSLIQVEGKLNKFFSKSKAILFKQYLFLPEEVDESEENFIIRIKLITHQHLNDIYSGNYNLSLEDYTVIAALFLIISSASPSQITYDRIVPQFQQRLQSKTQWQQKIGEIQTRMNEDMLQTYKYQLEDVVIQNNILSLRSQKFVEQDLNIKAQVLLESIISKHPLYGVTFFSIFVQKEKLTAYNLYFETQGYRSGQGQIILGISFNGYHFIEEKSRKQIVFIAYQGIKELKVFDSQVDLITKEVELQFQSAQAFQIYTLVEEYKYLGSQYEDELINIQ